LAIDTLFERADMMDVECAERFCDWFSHHLSNFDFKWHWQKWYARARSLSLSLHRALRHGVVWPNAAVFVCRACRACLRAYVLKMNEEEPKRLVVREILERTMWLAYYERVARTLPEEFIELMPCRPAPFLKYADVAAEVHLPDWPPHTAYCIPHSTFHIPPGLSRTPILGHAGWCCRTTRPTHRCWPR
jgi:nuclear cap-binding protein subunit 1